MATTKRARLYRETVDGLFSVYEALSERMARYLIEITPKPEEMKQDAYERTLKARAFDISRYLLPLATNTSLGEIVNARTLEMQVSHLLSDPHKEVRDLADLMKKAASSPAYNANHESLRELVGKIREVDSDLGARAEAELLREVRVAPTLVKYADPNTYEVETRRELHQAAAELMKGAPIVAAPAVDLLDYEPLDVELAATLLYEHCHYSYRQVRAAVESAGEVRRREIIDLEDCVIVADTTSCCAAFRAGSEFRFDILDGHRWIPRYAPSPALRADHAGLHDLARIRDAGRTESRWHQAGL